MDRSQMTHKNPELRASSVVSASAIKKETKAAPKKATAIKHDPVFELQGKKWVVEYQEKNPGIEIADTEIKQTVYIYK